MKLSDEFYAKVRKDWEQEEIEAVGDYTTYLAGYIACLKRFGGQRESSWVGDVDRQSGAFTQWEIDNATAWR